MGHFCLYICRVQTQSLEPAEKHLVRSRMIFSLGLFILLLALCGFMAAQAVDGEGIARYAWLSGVILLMVACVGFARISWRLGRDLIKGEKKIRVVPVMQKMEKGGKWFFQIEGKMYQVGNGLYGDVKRGEKVELHIGSGGFVFGIFPLPQN